MAIFLLGSLLLRAPGPDQLADLLLAGGLLDAPQHLQAIGGAHAQHGLDHVILQRAGENDAAAKAAEGEAAQQRHAIHARHAQIAKQDVDLMTLAHGQRLHPVLRLQQGSVTEPADLVHQRLALEGVIFHHHDHQLMLCLVHRAIIQFHL